MCEKLPSWQEMFPEGRVVFYEGDDPEGFVKEMKEKFNFDPSMTDVDFTALAPIPNTPNKAWGELIPGDADGPGFLSYAFHCPGHLMDKVYGGSYPLGS
jgi:hypothetical protein